MMIYNIFVASVRALVSITGLARRIMGWFVDFERSVHP